MDLVHELRHDLVGCYVYLSTRLAIDLLHVKVGDAVEGVTGQHDRFARKWGHRALRPPMGVIEGFDPYRGHRGLRPI